MNEEDRINAGVLFYAEAPELVEKKSKTHRLNNEYNMTFESDEEKAESCRDPYSSIKVHTKIGRNFFANFNFVVQDDAEVTIGDGCVVGVGAVVTRDISQRMFAAGDPCKAVRELTAADSIRNRPKILGG